ncbi:RKD3 [Acrasis kona]|uniref:RKD3 n=1 Tax=Acrasis kona TaxID=1008807 RepID=A0AAW2ZPD3_9EUKA
MCRSNIRNAGITLQYQKEDIKQMSTAQKKVIKGVVKKDYRPQKIEIPVHDIVRYLTIPQPIAASKLSVSISTLKRRYYELGFGRWPINSSNGDNGEEYLQSQNLPVNEKAQIKNIINKENVEMSAQVDVLTLRVLQCAFKC